MAISEQSRHELYRRLAEILGARPAATLMEHLPPVGWADVATKRDLDALEQRLRSDLRAEVLAAVNGAITTQTRTVMFSVIGSNVTVAALAFAAATLR
jgi:hypothetical protein